MLRICNDHLAPPGATLAGLTMSFKMATLNSRFPPCRQEKCSKSPRIGAEGSIKANQKFSDFFRHFLARSVARRRQLKGWGVAALAGLALAGCAMGMAPGGLSKDSPPEVKQQAVEARAVARWEALIKGDIPAAYAYLSPATRATTPLDVYKAKHKMGMYRQVKVDSVDCEGAVCTVKLTLRYDYKRFKGIETPLSEHWVIEDGQAWFVN
ncbi:MAG: hypothetical protein KGJ25_12210 [Betaproteobacteria bacterium]|nr:hypothetical protein [Betaproteobacteria bacterium]MDE2004285.1 hypothetical protein [Betaproteobacteria bacterium]